MLKYREITGVIHCKTGLRIGGSKDELEIGGVDNPIIRHPITRLPYIPGSSLKGKIRCLLEIKAGVSIAGNGLHNCNSCPICRNFGSLRSDSMTRFIFRDCNLTPDSQDKLTKAQVETGMNLAELKAEVSIDRRTGKAANKALRSIERVPAGTEFDFAMTIRSLKKDDPDEQANLILQGIKLLEQDYLGSSGSRGYGQVEFRDLKIDGKPLR